MTARLTNRLNFLRNRFNKHKQESEQSFDDVNELLAALCWFALYLETCLIAGLGLLTLIAFGLWILEVLHGG